MPIEPERELEWELVRAKVNLNLHVGRVIDDPSHPHHGYHPLSSLVVFADYGDELSCEPALETSLEISGPFSRGLEADETNLVLRAYQAVAEQAVIPSLKFHLIKKLPIASGIGGGSADAAAALRLLQNYVKLSDDDWHSIALSLGADVPVCLYSKTCVMSGIGEDLEFKFGLGTLSAVIINPAIAVSTGKVFKAFDRDDDIADLTQTSGNLLDMTLAGRNDLQHIAAAIDAEIQLCIDELMTCDGQVLVRMSGSGATCFAVFQDVETATIMSNNISKKFPHWWVRSVTLGDTS